MDGNTDKLSSCEQCKQVIARGPNYIRCEGSCSNVYHASCVKLTREDLLKYNQSHNLWWMCDSCSDMKVKERNNHRTHAKECQPKANSLKANEIVRIDDEIATLKKQITAIHQSLASASIASSRTGPAVDSSNVKRTAAEPSVIALPDTQLGTRTMEHPRSIVEQKSANDRFWVFLSRIKNSVSERDVFKLVTDTLGSDDIIVKKLVPTWKDCCSMPFISFKVGIDVHLKRKALSPSTWPVGLHFREFRNNYWEPL